MTFPLVPSPLGGNLGAKSASILRLDPLGTVPIEPVLDLVPGLTEFRITADMVDQEGKVHQYDVTEHPVQSFLDITSNVHKRLERMILTVTLGATLPLRQFPSALVPEIPSIPGSEAIPVLPLPPQPGGIVRMDLLRLRNLVKLADTRAPVMVVTPRVGMPRAFIETISEAWSPANGESLTVTISFKEARLVNPLLGASLTAPDYPASATGNNATTGGGQSQTSIVNEAVKPAPTNVDALPPTFGAAPGALT